MVRAIILVSLAAFGTTSSRLASGQQSMAHIYVADTGNHRIIRLDDMAGRGWAAFGTKGKGTGQFDSPLGISVDGRGRIIIADVSNVRVVRMDDMQGKNWTTFRTMPREVNGERSDGPALWALWVGANGGIYTANGLFGQIAYIPDLAGKRIRFYEPHDPKTLVFASGITVDRDGRIYVTERAGSIVRMDDIHGSNWTRYGTSGHGKGEFDGPSGICLDAKGRIYVTDSGNNRIVRMDDMHGKGWKTFGTRGSQKGQFDGPTGICQDQAGHIYVADSGNHRIVRMDDMTGAHWIAFGIKGHGIGQFDNAQGIFVR